MPLTIWTNVPMTSAQEERLRAAVQPHALAVSRQEGASNLVSGDPDPRCREADIAFGQPHPDDVLASETLRWIHLTSAGYTRYDRDDVREAVARRGVLTNSSGVYDDPCAQHVLGMMLLMARRFLPCAEDQKEGHWSYGDHRPHMRILRGDRVLIVGYGAIGRRLEQLLSPFGVEVRGLRRNPRPGDGGHVFPMSEFSSLLGWADHVVDILPASPSTVGTFDYEAFAAMKKGSAFYNIGRGDTVVQEDLAKTLEEGHLGCACLDVTTPEPLPKHHPLWSLPRCFITPHLAGGLQAETDVLLDFFVARLEEFEDGAGLQGVVFPPQS